MSKITLEAILHENGVSPAFHGLTCAEKKEAIPILEQALENASSPMELRFREWLSVARDMIRAEEMLQNPHLNLDATIPTWKSEVRGSIWGVPMSQNFAKQRTVGECLQAVASGDYEITVGLTLPAIPLLRFLGNLLEHRHVLK